MPTEQPVHRMRIQVILPIREDLVEATRAILRGGAEAIQLRDKTADDEAFLAAARKVKDACEEMGGMLIVNDRVHVARMAGAHGLHLGQGDMPGREARRTLGEGPIIGISSHSVEEALRAEEAGADYVSVGCIFPSPTKPDLVPVGPEMVRSISDRIAPPIVAIGGITRENVARVIEAGAQAVAVSSTVTYAPDMEQAVRRLREAFPSP